MRVCDCFVLLVNPSIICTNLDSQSHQLLLSLDTPHYWVSLHEHTYTLYSLPYGPSGFHSCHPSAGHSSASNSLSLPLSLSPALYVLHSDWLHPKSSPYSPAQPSGEQVFVIISCLCSLNISVWLCFPLRQPAESSKNRERCSPVFFHSYLIELLMWKIIQE